MRYFEITFEDGNIKQTHKKQFILNKKNLTKTLYDKVKSECSNYIEISSKTKYQSGVFRGIGGETEFGGKATYQFLEYYLNNAFGNNGFKANRLSLYVTGNISMARDYGENLYEVFLPNNTEIVWSRTINDLYSIYEFNGEDIIEQLGLNELTHPKTGKNISIEGMSLKKQLSYLGDEKKQDIESWANNFIKENYEKGNLLEAINSGNEIMAESSIFYLINTQNQSFYHSFRESNTFEEYINLINQ